MEKDEEDTDRADVLDQQEIEVEIVTAKSTPIGEFVAHELVGDKPAEEDAGQKTYDGEENLSGDEIEPVEEGTSKKDHGTVAAQ